MQRAFFSDTISSFLDRTPDAILGQLARSSSAVGATLESTQTDAWQEQINLLKAVLRPYRDAGSLYFEYSIPRLGKRIDVLVLLGAVILVLEFKVGEER